MSSSTKKPLPLKQRTSSIDQRREHALWKWASLQSLISWREYVVTVDHTSLWRRHVAWSMKDKNLRDYTTQRYSSGMVILSLLLSTELGVLFNSNDVATHVRHQLMNANHMSLGFWAGLVIIVSSTLTIFGLISTFTAWNMVSAVSYQNARCVLRSSIGQHVTELPWMFFALSIYSFLLWLSMFFFLLISGWVWSLILLAFVVILFVYTISCFSIFGRIIMHTGAMGSQSVFDPEYEKSLTPQALDHNLVARSRETLSSNTSVIRQYRQKRTPIGRQFSEDSISLLMSDGTFDDCDVTTPVASKPGSPAPPPPVLHPAAPPVPAVPYEIAELDRNQQSNQNDTSTSNTNNNRRRAGSLVKFSDGYDTSGERVSLPPPPDVPPSSSTTTTAATTTTYSSDGQQQEATTTSNRLDPDDNSIAQRTISDVGPADKKPSHPVGLLSSGPRPPRPLHPPMTTRTQAAAPLSGTNNRSQDRRKQLARRSNTPPSLGLLPTTVDGGDAQNNDGGVSRVVGNSLVDRWLSSSSDDGFDEESPNPTTTPLRSTSLDMSSHNNSAVARQKQHVRTVSLDNSGRPGRNDGQANRTNSRRGSWTPDASGGAEADIRRGQTSEGRAVPIASSSLGEIDDGASRSRRHRASGTGNIPPTRPARGGWGHWDDAGLFDPEPSPNATTTAEFNGAAAETATVPTPCGENNNGRERAVPASSEEMKSLLSGDGPGQYDSIPI